MAREMSSGTDVTVRHLLQLSREPNLPNLFEASFPVRSKRVFPQRMDYLLDMNHMTHGKEKASQPVTHVSQGHLTSSSQQTFKVSSLSCRHLCAHTHTHTHTHTFIKW